LGSQGLITTSRPAIGVMRGAGPTADEPARRVKRNGSGLFVKAIFKPLPLPAGSGMQLHFPAWTRFSFRAEPRSRAPSCNEPLHEAEHCFALLSSTLARIAPCVGPAQSQKRPRRAHWPSRELGAAASRFVSSSDGVRPPFDHLVGAGETHWRGVDAERLQSSDRRRSRPGTILYRNQ
jgi:hypothetical protein